MSNNENNNKLNILLDNIKSFIIEEVEITNIQRNFDLLNYMILNKPLNIKHYNNNLYPITNLNIKCNNCNKIADYKVDLDKSLCWDCSLKLI